MGGLRDTLGRIARSQEAWQGDGQKNHYVWELGQEMFGSHKGKQVKMSTGIKERKEKGVCGEWVGAPVVLSYQGLPWSCEQHREKYKWRFTKAYSVVSTLSRCYFRKSQV